MSRFIDSLINLTPGQLFIKYWYVWLIIAVLCVRGDRWLHRKA